MWPVWDDNLIRNCVLYVFQKYERTRYSIYWRSSIFPGKKFQKVRLLQWPSWNNHSLSRIRYWTELLLYWLCIRTRQKILKLFIHEVPGCRKHCIVYFVLQELHISMNSKTRNNFHSMQAMNISFISAKWSKASWIPAYTKSCFVKAPGRIVLCFKISICLITNWYLQTINKSKACSICKMCFLSS